MSSPELDAWSAADRVRARRVTVAFWVVALVFGFLQAWVARFTIGNDCVSFLDMGDAYFRGDWKMVINGYYFPFWAWILGLTMRILKPSAFWEYFVVELVNLGIFLLCAASFDFLLRELLRDYRAALSQRSGLVVWPEWVWRTLGYTVFLWSSLALIQVSDTNPDMLVALFVYLAAGLLVRMRGGRAGRWHYVAFGAVLGLAYLTKSAMFPLAFVFLAVAAFAAPDWRRSFPRLVGALAAFLIVAGPYVFILSLHRGRFDFGDSGRLNYAWLVNGTPSRHWQGEPADAGQPLHPTRQLLSVPAVYEFDGPVGETYPLWYDVSYWYEGLRVHFYPARQLRALVGTVEETLSVFLGLNGAIVVGLALLVGMRGRAWSVARDLSDYWFLLVPAAAGISLYVFASVLPRYIAAFVVLLVVGTLLAIRLADSVETRRLGTALPIVFSAMLLSPVGPGAFPKHLSSVRELLSGPSIRENTAWQVADGLRRVGLSAGDRVAVLEYGNFDHVHWARLARVQIIAEVFFHPDRPNATNDFWKLESSARARVIDAFAKTGARVVVSDREPPRDATAAWEQIGNTRYHVYWLERREVRPKADMAHPSA